MINLKTVQDILNDYRMEKICQHSQLYVSVRNRFRSCEFFSSECYVFSCYDNKIGQKTSKANFQHMLLGQSLKNQCNSSFIFCIHVIAHLLIIITMLLHICIVRLLILCCIRSMRIMNPVKYMYIEVRYTTYFHIGYNYLAYLEALGNRIFT